MTIAVCYLTPEGVVLGADSTTSFACDTGMHYFDFNQKVLEIGEASTFGMVTWGLGDLGSSSHRTLVALLADEFARRPPTSLSDVAERWRDHFWLAYQACPWVQRCLVLAKQTVHVPGTPPDPTQRTKQDQDEFEGLCGGLGVGFTVGGYVLPDRTPYAFTMYFGPLDTNKPSVVPVAPPFNAWGVPNIVRRLIFGADVNLTQAVLQSGKWTGTDADFEAVVAQQALTHATLPVRDAIDFVHFSIHSTIKAMKFSSMPQVCGGPIEIAVITTDRKFRWVRHKQWDAAITDGGI